jgi:hypothetical protein
MILLYFVSISFMCFSRSFTIWFFEYWVGLFHFKMWNHVFT